MRSAIGTTSASAAQFVAKVWKRKDPIPTSAVSTASTSTPRSLPRDAASPTPPATRNAVLVSALTGSAQKAGSSCSQEASIGRVHRASPSCLPIALVRLSRGAVTPPPVRPACRPRPPPVPS